MQQNPYRAPEESAPVSAPSRQFFLSPLACFYIEFYGLAIFWGMRSAVVTDPTIGDWILNVALSTCLCMWAIADARQNQKPFPRSQELWVFSFAILVVPGYVILTRGWKGLGWVALHSVAWTAIVNLAMYATFFAYYGFAW